MRRNTNSVAIFSGGLDSTTLVYDMREEGYTPHLLSFDYGQRHKKELVFARATASRLNLPHDVIDLTGITHLISNSALTADLVDLTIGAGMSDQRTIEVPEGHYAEENMKATVVPNRNMIMIAIAAGVAVNEDAQVIGLGVHAGDHFVYPDCRPGFISTMSKVLFMGNEGFHTFNNGRGALYTPFLHESKAEIAYRALALNVPLHATWSCYKGDVKHCGRCGTCVERLEAIHDAKARWAENHPGPEQPMDMTSYEDNEFWKAAISA